MERYTLRELFDKLKIPIAELGRRAGISEVTVAKIRDGHSARRSTVNSLLDVFSQLYGVELSIGNVGGIIIKDKLARREEAEKSHTDVTEQVPMPSTSDAPVVDTTKKKASQNRNVSVSEGIPTDLPQGTVKLVDFVAEHGLPDSSVGRWVATGLKGEKLQTVERIGRNGRPQHFLTPELQEKALDLLRRRGKLNKQPKSKQFPPEGTLSADTFAKHHGVDPDLFQHHRLTGIGHGTVPGEQADPTLPVNESVDYSHDPKHGDYLTPEQQQKVLDQWKRYNVIPKGE